MATRKNYCPNPSCKVDTTGWSGGGSSPAFSRATNISGQPRSTGILWTGNGFSQTPAGVCAAGDIFTVSFYLTNRTTFSVNSKIAYISYTRSSGGDTFPQTMSIPNTADGATSRASFTTSAAPSLATGIYLIIDAINGTGGSGIWIGSVLFEKVGSLGAYFDGDSANAVWDGTDGKSTSTYTDPPTVKPGAFLPFL